MPARYEFRIAGVEEDAGLRAVLRETAMPGRVSISFRTEPSFFAAERIGSLESQVVAVWDTAAGKIVGLGSRSFRRVFVDGEIRVCGYLGGLRGLAGARGMTLLARGYQFLKELHGDGRASYYVTTILDDNHYARGLLTSGRAGLPVYEPFGRLQTYLLPLHRKRRRSGRSDCVVRGVHGEMLGAAVQNINAFNRGHQFGPCYAPADFEGRTRLIEGFDPARLYVYKEGSQIIATLGVWDLMALKQWVVTGYRYPLTASLSCVGALLGLMPRLPGVGSPVRLLYGAFVSCLPGREAAFETLVHAVMDDWSRGEHAYLAVGVGEGSPLGRVLEARSAGPGLSSTVYLAYWPDTPGDRLPSKELAPHLEIASL